MPRSISIDLPTDDDGMLPRQCPTCERTFAIHRSTYREQHYLNLRCPYCGWIAEFDQFLTDEQADFAEATAENEARELAESELEEALSDIFGTVDDLDFGRQSVPSPHLDVPMTSRTCDNCGFRYHIAASYQDASRCPVCREHT